MSVFARLKKAREEKKGFTLVELIVVLVILAILAAILVPALLGWIDKAKDKQYVLDARNVYLATQTIMDEHYAKGVTDDATMKALSIDEKDEIKRIADVNFTDITVTSFEDRVNATTGAATLAKAKINAMTITGLDGEVTATLGDGTWTITKGKGGTTPPTPEDEDGGGSVDG